MEIKATNIHNTWASINDIQFDRMGAEVIYKLLTELGAAKDMEFHWNEDNGKISIHQKFYYESGMMPDEEDTGKREGTQLYTLGSYIKRLVRWDRAAYKRMKNVEQKINQMHNGIEALRKQL